MKRIDLGWSSVEERRLIDLLNSGMTYSEIAQTMGREKNSIAGKVHRLRYKRKDTALPKPKSASQAGKRSIIMQSKRQGEVADLLAEDLTFDQIAERLGITRHAVRHAFDKICRKLGWQAQ